MISHIEVRLPKKHPTPKNISDALGGPQRQFWKEALFVQYDKKTNVSLLSAPTQIKFIPERKTFHRSLISPIIKGGDCYDPWTFVAHQCASVSSQIKYIDFDKSYSPVAHSDYLIINISIADMHILTVNILDVSNKFQNKKLPLMK